MRLNALRDNLEPAGSGWRGRRSARVLLGAAALVWLVGCERDDAQKMQMPPRPPARVTVVTAITRDVPVYFDQIGKTVAMEVVSIVPQVGGKLVAAHVEHGDYVKKGQLLFEIDPRPFEAALASAKASLAQNKADLDLARVELNRFREAVSAVSKLEFDQKQGAVAVAEAKVEAGEAEVQTAKLNLEYAKIYSPIDGRAGVRLVDAGNIVKANDAPLLVIQRMDPIYAEFTVTENDLGTVRKFMASSGLSLTASPEKGLKAQVDVPGDSIRVLSALGVPVSASRPEGGRIAAAGAAGPREGTLTFLDNAVQRETGTVKLRAALPNADGYFWPGQFVNVRLVLTTKKGAVLIPAESQQIGQQGPYVYVVRPDGMAELRPITPGQRQGNLVVVEQGVQPGEKVVVTGHMAVMPNSKVLVTNDGPGSTQPSAAMANKRAS